MQRPRPPQSLLDVETALDEGSLHRSFVPAPDLIEWAVATFIAEGAALENEDHAHLRHARLAALWTSVPNSRNGRAIVGQCERGKPGGTMGKWARARAEQQIAKWFGTVPDFILTFDAGYAAAASDAEFCALTEHELYHAGQAHDEYGAPRFVKDTGLPAFTIRPHDVEEFIGVVKRYGADATHVAAFVVAAQTAGVPAGRIAAACGTCLS